ncbi:probable BOI-related E3 ubiquitin-protein ligase 3 [Amborella trichopoda]|nr:probable BOI-related E3 ubiquitin-protein ligase 3 [Amborella trichopoda]|eukprot:XP_006857405.2 probable BOI-related E3 ubiquitin-protein ligase 3 [Amborella trichopoda]
MFFEASPSPLMAETLNPFYNLPFSDPFQLLQNPSQNLTPLYNPGFNSIQSFQENELIPRNFNGSRKRGREGDLVHASMDGWICPGFRSTVETSSASSCTSNVTIDPEIHAKIQGQHQEIERLLLIHTETMRFKLEQKRRIYWQNLMILAERAVAKIMKGKEEQIEEISRRNAELEEKLNILQMEGQIWQSLAKSNEATVVALRRDLDEAMAGRTDDDVVGDTESRCEGNDEVDGDGGFTVGPRCKACGTRERRVVVLPCRHLCVCEGCEVGLERCLICMGKKSATVHVYMS